MNPIKIRIYNKTCGSYCSDYRYHGGISVMEQDSDEVWQLFTGIKDKNGRDIYEGDLVNFSWRSGPAEAENETLQEVFFEDGLFLFSRKLFFCMADCNFMDGTLVVVGNVFGANFLA